MEFELFQNIRDAFCIAHENVTEGKMMSSPAIHYRGKVFAFFSRKKKMVFKLGKNFNVENFNVPLIEFSPFKTKKRLTGWYEVDFLYKDTWQNFAEIALKLSRENKHYDN